MRTTSTRRRVRTLAAVAATALAASAHPVASAMSGGLPVTAGEPAWFASLSFRGINASTATGLGSPVSRLHCGGALVAPDRVLTAGHCVLAESSDGDDRRTMRPHDLSVTLGTGDLGSGGETHRVRDIALLDSFTLVRNREHPEDVDRAAATGDLALLTLDGTARATPVPLADSEPAPGTGVSFYGHGVTPDGPPSVPLLRGELRTVHRGACAAELPIVGDVPDAVCATGEGPAGPVQAGYMDSGGPLVADTGAPALLGVFSFGTETGAGLFTPGPNVFTSVAVHRAEIERLLSEPPRGRVTPGPHPTVWAAVAGLAAAVTVAGMIVFRLHKR